ncbi:TRAP transporter small permease [Vannielia litorea]|uniref:TRAP transporter small permease n=1 Tax=Vannielia litorea TaxID=1217970 RepID=UPI001BCB66D3|nr:TRAP transporter small permease [Vannielia litorea]MBS8228240.1 TRAP transporter small permease [Vannielia litorea]
MRNLQRALERFSHWVEIVAGVMMGFITLLVVVSAVTRYLFAWPLPDAFDLSRYLLGAAIMWGFACVGFRGSHIKVDLLAEALPTPVRRWVDALAWAVLLFFTALLAWKLLGRVTSAAGSGEATMDLRLPAWPLMALIWAGVAVSLATITARLLIILFGHGSLDHFDSAEEHAE